MESKKKMKQENLDLQLQKLLDELKLDLAPQVTKKAPEVPPVVPQEKENPVSLKKGQKKQEHWKTTLVKYVHLLKKKQKDYQNKYLMVLAEKENFKKNLLAEQAELVKYRATDVIRALLPAIDNFEIALNQSPSDPQIINFLKGFQMTYKAIIESFQSEGIKTIPAKIGQSFDYHLHSAYATEYKSGVPPNQILKIIKKGYQLSDRVLRHTVVIVSGEKVEEQKHQQDQKKVKK